MDGDYSNVGAVVGATYPEMGRVLRKVMPKAYILVPGYAAIIPLELFTIAPSPSGLKKSTRSLPCPPCAPYPGTRIYALGITFLNTLPISG